ncbi:LysR family transcriptional regulator [Hoeflea poritis]|uniref:LysR family transcriptional regulator n=1 Tax=Hoeflea poritis TaxID=2993659 RepID=A0ABT4VVP5_9HYPH|nr:LysR family transcriptional regulator [Hoeflea poritis]MDA4848694.1 LysR family transcriptional regulator [Hoeflea poritis]
MKLTIRQIEYVYESGQLKSITAASKKLNISQSSVVAAINLAEEITGATLFYRRKGHGMEVTPAGQDFLVSARRVLASNEEFERSMRAFSNPSSPTLRLGCFSPFGSILIPPVLKRYIKENGKCSINLLEGDQAELRNWLIAGDVDLVVTYDIGEMYGVGVTPICKCPAHALLNRDDPDAKKNSIAMKQLSRKPHILLDLPETRSYLLALLDYTGQRPDIVLRTRSYNTIRTAVADGLGSSMLNIRPAASGRDSESLVRVPISDKLRDPTLVVADPYGEHKPAYVRSFIKVLHRYFVDLGPQNFAVVLPDDAQGLLFPEPDV